MTTRQTRFSPEQFVGGRTAGTKSHSHARAAVLATLVLAATAIRPFLGERACQCGGAGAPCPDCNRP
jgi:hypothetical protein